MAFLDWLGAAGPNQYRGSLAAVNQWAKNAGAAACPGRGPENVALIESMFTLFYDRYKSIPRDAYMVLAPNCANSEQDLARAIVDSTNFQNFGNANTEYYKSEFRKAVKMVYGFAINMSNWAFPACEHYYTAKRTEAGGATADFTTKHLASTDNEKSSVTAARIRATPVAARTVHAYGNILTSHSGAVKKESTDGFLQEVRNRQVEFRDTHILLCRYFARDFLSFEMPPRAQFHYVDGVTFVTSDLLQMFEFSTVDGMLRRGEGGYYVHFSLSSVADGSAFAVHHLATTNTVRLFLPNNKVRVSDAVGVEQGLTAPDGATYMAG